MGLEKGLNIKLVDMHNHTIWSDGVNTPEEIIEHGISKNIDIIGITDHFNLNTPSLKPSQLIEYINDINKLKKKYKKFIKVRIGIEIKITPYPESFESLFYNDINKLDFILIENLEFLWKRFIFQDLEKYMKNIHCNIGLAHTDLFNLALKYKEKGGIDYVLNFLNENNIFWEINTNSAYQCFDNIICNTESKEVQELIKKLIQNNIKVTVGSDKHSLDDFELGRFLKGNEVANYIHFKSK